jgi:hypothetical protein
MLKTQFSGFMVARRLTAMAAILAFGLALGGCSKCGFFWDDWSQAPKSCKDEIRR